MEEVRRDDGELCGFVRACGDGWRAETVFGAGLGDTPARADAERLVREIGLASLADRWLLMGPDGDERIVCIQEASPAGVTLALDYYSLPGVPTLRIDRGELDTGRYELRRS